MIYTRWQGSSVVLPHVSTQSPIGNTSEKPSIKKAKAQWISNQEVQWLQNAKKYISLKSSKVKKDALLAAIVRQTFITMKRYLWPYIQFAYAYYSNYSKIG